MITLTTGAQEALRPGEVVLIDWHLTGLCCADAGEFSFRALPTKRLPKTMRAVPAAPDGSVYAHPMAWMHLAEHDVQVDCRMVGPWRRFVTDLPPDAGLRACLGRLHTTNPSHGGTP